MKINKICVQDYRSLGDCTAIGFASNIAVLVGRNEAGKSNVIDALSNVRFFEDMGADVIPMTDRNRIRNNSCVRVSVDLEYDDGDIALLNGVGEVPSEERKLCLLLLRDATTLRLSLDGLFCGVLRRDSVMREVALEAEKLQKFYESMKHSNGSEATAFYDGLRGREVIYVRNARKTLLEWGIHNVLPHVQDKAMREKYSVMLDKLVSALERLYTEFRKISPVFYKFEDSCELHSEYRLEELERPRDFRKDNLVGLDRYLGAINLTRDDLISAFKEQNSSLRQKQKNKFIFRTEKKLEEFNLSYMRNEAEIRLLPSIEGDCLTFSVVSDRLEESVLLRERSAGLRWYLNAFFESERSKIRKNSVLLIDEPAAYMHVNAQREVLALFNSLATESHYLLYSTHSPYMIDTAHLENVKAVVKENGIARIDDIHNVGGCRGWQDALTPVCEAMGVDLRYNVGPLSDRLNLVLEGPSDGYYINAMLDYLNVKGDRRPQIIAGMGVHNAKNIEAILLGWGCKVCVIVDNDKAGRREYENLVQYIKDVEKPGRAIFVSPVDGHVVENLLSGADYRRLFGVEQTPAELHNAPVKLLRAKEFARSVCNGNFKPDDETKANFIDLFARAGILGFEFRPIDPSGRADEEIAVMVSVADNQN